MTPELEKQIHEAAPKLYHTEPHPFDKENLSVNQLARISSPDLGCGDGWYHILLGLSQALEELDEDINVVQVKEKLGTLRFYVEGASEIAHDLIDQAEAMSAKTCEVCGEPGKLKRRDGWISVACSKHGSQ